MTEMRMAIEGMGVVGGFGSDLPALEAALQNGHVTPSQTSIETAQGPKELSVYRADTNGLDEFFQKRELRRIDHYSRMALFTASMALKDAGKWGSDQGATGVVVATGYGPHSTTFSFLDSYIKDGDTYSSPTQFASSVHNVAAAYLAILLKQTGPSLTVSQFDMSVSSALITAWCWLNEGCIDTVLFGAVDEYSGVLGYCYDRLFGAENLTEMQPLDFKKQSAIPGEGSAFFVLSRDESRAKHGIITGASSCFDGNRKLNELNYQPLIIGADGHRETGASYAALISGRNNVACHTALYGSLPVGQAFDMAIAALSCVREGRPTRCLKISREGEFGIVELSASRSTK